MTLNVLLKNVGLFLLLIFLQVFLLNNISLTKFGININFYVLLILILPFEISGWLLLLSAFFLGLSLDMFADTGGVNAASLVFVAFFRPLILKILNPRDGYLPDTKPGIFQYGFLWFLKYAFILVFIHNLLYWLFLEFSFSNFFLTLYKALISTFLVLILVLLSQFLFGKNTQ
ncbi:MAG: rod shape-determining protein MreD [Bacteroidetes bacterium]|nr:MAG: rod shape-determining protein MreD [Bacteroidota bacterium]